MPQEGRFDLPSRWAHRRAKRLSTGHGRPDRAQRAVIRQRANFSGLCLRHGSRQRDRAQLPRLGSRGAWSMPARSGRVPCQDRAPFDRQNRARASAPGRGRRPEPARYARYQGPVPRETRDGIRRRAVTTVFAGAPGSGKSCAARLPSYYRRFCSKRETSMIHSVAGLLDEGGISHAPLREPHRLAEAAVSGAVRNPVRSASPRFVYGQTLNSTVLETLRQPETGEVMVAPMPISTPAGLWSPCQSLPLRISSRRRACLRRAPVCGDDYMGEIWGR